MLVIIVEMRTEEHSLRSQVGIGIGSESHCLLGQLRRIFEISYSDAGLKVEKSGSKAGGEGVWRCHGEIGRLRRKSET